MVIHSTKKAKSLARNTSEIGRILNYDPITPVRIYSNPSDANKENVAPNILNAEAEKVKLKQDLNKSVISLNNAEVSTDRDFCQTFSRWLNNTQCEIDADIFAKLKEELYGVVGKYTSTKVKEN